MYQDSPPHRDMDNNPEEDEMLYGEDIIEEYELDMEEDESMEDEEIESFDGMAFTQHTDSVFCGSLNSDGTLAITGGQDDTAYVWNTSTGETLFKCDGHNDSVIFVGFSPDDLYIASADMSGHIKVWSVTEKKCVWSDATVEDATWALWHNVKNVIFAGTDKGQVYMWRIPDGACRVFQGFGEKSETGTVTNDGKQIIVSYADGMIRVLDIKSGSVQMTIPAHSGIITSLDCQWDGKIIVSASDDGTTVLSTTQTGKIVAVLQKLSGQNRTSEENEDEDEHEENQMNKNWVEAVAFSKNPELRVVATGTINGEIYIWDTVRQAIRHEIRQEYGVSKIVWKGNSAFFFAAGLNDGVIRCYDARTGQCIKTLKGHSENILDLQISKNCTKMLTTSDDKTARVFELNF